MKLILNPKKPTLTLSSPALCDFRSGKAYLWGLVRDRLYDIQHRKSTPIHVLDAACHALITRDMFPKNSLYYGLDISRSRLQSASKLRHANDVLYLADITKPLPLKYSFECVVSCNTLCHIPDELRLRALSNLVDCCAVGGDFLVSIPLASYLFDFTSFLLDNFQSVEPIYYDSYISARDEQNKLVNKSNIFEKIQSNELLLPNDASLHRQVFFHAYSRVYSSSIKQNPPRSPNKILKLNHVPTVNIFKFADDAEAIVFLNSLQTSSVILSTSYLFFSDVGQFLIDSLNVPIHRLDHFSPSADGPQELYVLGLESDWSDNPSNDRISINRLKNISTISVSFVLVSARNGSKCTPSLVAQDH